MMIMMRRKAMKPYIIILVVDMGFMYSLSDISNRRRILICLLACQYFSLSDWELSSASAFSVGWESGAELNRG